MGLFSKKSPAEKRLKEITGGFLLSSSFIKLLRKNGLEISDGSAINEQVKRDIKNGDVDEDGVELRINYLIKEYSKDFHDSIEVKKLKFLVNQEHNIRKCPNCNTYFLKNDNYCYECGRKVYVKAQSKIVEDIQDGDIVNFVKKDMKIGTLSKTSSNNQHINNLRNESKHSVNTSNNNPNSYNRYNISKLDEHYDKNHEELSELEDLYTKNKKQAEISNLESLYNDKISEDYSANFKFAYVLYLTELNKHPTKKFTERYKDQYKTTIAKLKKQAKIDGYVQEGSPLSAAKDATVKDIKEVLKKHNLKVSGRKDELIKRLGESLSNEELKKEFPKKSLELSPEGIEFIKSNDYVLYYDKNWDLKLNISSEDFDSIFTKGYEDKEFYDLVIKFLKERESKLINKRKWVEYGKNLRIICSIYEDDIKAKHSDEKEHILLDYYFKSLIYTLNNYSPYTEKCEPGSTYIESQEIDDLIELMHSLTLDLDVLKSKFNKAYNDLKVPNLVVSIEDSLIFLLKAFNGEDIIDLNEEFRIKYGGENFNY